MKNNCEKQTQFKKRNYKTDGNEKTVSSSEPIRSGQSEVELCYWNEQESNNSKC